MANDYETKVGTPLRDAAVDPKPEDFLPPTNAGQEDPHGPLVVAPEIHAAEGVKPVVGGEVHVDDSAAQSAKELAATEGAMAGPVATAVGGEPPAGNASTDEWRDYATSRGATEDDVDGLSRDELRERYG
jgi:hypothetical protein